MRFLLLSNEIDAQKYIFEYIQALFAWVSDLEYDVFMMKFILFGKEILSSERHKQLKKGKKMQIHTFFCKCDEINIISIDGVANAKLENCV